MSEDKIKIIGIGGIVLKGGKPEPDKDYLISLRAALSEIRKNVKDTNNPYNVYVMDYINTELVQLIGGKKIEVQKGKTQSQVQRFLIEDIAVLKGLDKDDYYKQRMSQNIEKLRQERDGI